MNPIILDDIRFQPNIRRLIEGLHVAEGTEDAESVLALAEEAAHIARPKAVFKEAGIDDRGDDYVVIDGVRFASRILAVNLSSAHRLFPYVATCGTELEAWAKGLTDMMAQWWADGIMQAALRSAFERLNKAIDEYAPGKTATMNPGSLEDWPIEEQRPMWRLLDDPKAQIGVTLTDSMLMIPAKSVSGLRFPTEVNYENCQLCRRETCPGRRAPFDETLYERHYRK